MVVIVLLIGGYYSLGNKGEGMVIIIFFFYIRKVKVFLELRFRFQTFLCVLFFGQKCVIQLFLVVGGVVKVLFIFVSFCCGMYLGKGDEIGCWEVSLGIFFIQWVGG